MARGGWFKSYDDELNDPKIQRLGEDDFAYRVWRYALDLCNRSPARLRERGYLYHSKGFPVEVCDFSMYLQRDPEAVEGALEKLCSIGGEASLLLREEVEKQSVLRVRNWRKRQESRKGSQGEAEIPEDTQETPELSRPYVDKDARRRRKTSVAAGSAAECPFCKWRKDNPEKRPPTPGKDEYSPKWRGQCYHDSACDSLGVECFTVTGKEAKLLKSAITKYGERTVWKWWLQFLKTRVDIGHSIAVFASNTSLVKFSEEKASG